MQTVLGTSPMSDTQMLGHGQPFMFAFPTGPKWSSEMTREELLHVIDYLQRSVEFYKRQIYNFVEMGEGCG